MSFLKFKSLVLFIKIVAKLLLLRPFQSRSIDKVHNLEMQSSSTSDSGHNNFSLHGKICGEMFYPNLKL